MQKKGGGGGGGKGEKAGKQQTERSGGGSSKATSNEDPYDFSALDADINAAIERLRESLSKLRSGGRFNPETLENLRVQVEKSSNAKVKLSDVAQVIPKGRTVQVVVGTKDVSGISETDTGRQQLMTFFDSTSSRYPRPSKAATCP